MTTDLHRATAADREFLCRLYASTRAQELAAVPWDGEQKAAFLRMQFDAQDRWYREQMPDASYDVVVVDGVRAGRLYVDRREEEIRIVDIALLPEWRNAGVGTALLRAVLVECEACGKAATLHVEADNRARALYERLGFETVGTSGVYARLECRMETAVGGSTC